MKATLIRPGELGPRECDRWRGFQAAHRQLQSPFLTPDFALAVDKVCKSARVAVFEDGRDIVGFLPFQLHARGVAVPIGRKLNTRQAFVHCPGLPWSWSALLTSARLDVLEMQDVVGAQGVGFRSLIAGRSPVIDTGGGWHQYLSRISQHKSVRTILYKERKLHRDRDGDVAFDSGPARTCADLNLLAAWKSRQYRRSGWPDLFAHRETLALLTLLAEEPGTQLRAVGSSLRVGDEVVATDMSLATDTVFAGWFAAHNPDFGCHSPGAIRTLRTVQAAFDSGVRWIDLSKGDERYKDALTNDHCDVATGFVFRRSIHSRAYQMRRWPKSTLTNFVLTHPSVRSLVRDSLRHVGEVRERCAVLMG